MRTVRVGTVVWGAILLAFAVVVFSIAVFDLRVFQAATVTWVLIGLGGVLVLAALIAAIARAVSGGSREPQAATTEVPEPESPTSAGTEPATPTKVGNSKSATGTAATKKGQPVD